MTTAGGQQIITDQGKKDNVALIRWNNLVSFIYTPPSVPDKLTSTDGQPSGITDKNKIQSLLLFTEDQFPYAWQMYSRSIPNLMSERGRFYVLSEPDGTNEIGTKQYKPRMVRRNNDGTEIIIPIKNATDLLDKISVVAFNGTNSSLLDVKGYETNKGSPSNTVYLLQVETDINGLPTKVVNVREVYGFSGRSNSPIFRTLLGAVEGQFNVPLSAGTPPPLVRGNVPKNISEFGSFLNSLQVGTGTAIIVTKSTGFPTDRQKCSITDVSTLLKQVQDLDKLNLNEAKNFKTPDGSNIDITKFPDHLHMISYHTNTESPVLHRELNDGTVKAFIQLPPPNKQPIKSPYPFITIKTEAELQKRLNRFFDVDKKQENVGAEGYIIDPKISYDIFLLSTNAAGEPLNLFGYTYSNFKLTPIDCNVTKTPVNNTQTGSPTQQQIPGTKNMTRNIGSITGIIFVFIIIAIIVYIIFKSIIGTVISVILGIIIAIIVGIILFR